MLQPASTYTEYEQYFICKTRIVEAAESKNESVCVCVCVCEREKEREREITANSTKVAI
jgi:hypothetical protein